MTLSPKLHKNDKLWGAVAEALVAAYALIGANGKLTSYRLWPEASRTFTFKSSAPLA